MEQLLTNFLSSDESTQQKATEELNEMIEDSSIFPQLFEQFPQHQNDPLTRAISIILLDSIRRKFKEQTIEDKNTIAEQVFAALFLVNPDISPHLIECARIILSDNEINPDPYVSTAFEHIHSMDDIEKVYSSLSVVSAWLLVKGVSKSFFVPEIQAEMANLITTFNALLSDESNYRFISLITDITNHLLFIDPHIYEVEETIPLFTHFIEVLGSESCPEKEKSSIYNLLQFNLTSFTNANCKPNQAQFNQAFMENICPALVESLLTKFPKNQLQISYAYKLINTLVYRGINTEQFLNPEYFFGVLVEGCKLTSEDVQTFEAVPEQFFSFCYDVVPKTTENECYRDENDILTPRIAFSKLVKTIANTPAISEFMGSILEFGTSESSDETELEVKLFLLSLYTMAIRENESILPFITSILEQTDSPIVTATCLSVLVNLEGDNESKMQIATQFMSTDYNACISLLAVYAFDRAYSCDTELPCEMNELVLALLQIASTICDPLPGTLLNALCRHNPEAFKDSAAEIIQSFLSMWSIYEESHYGNNIIIGITNMISFLPVESEEFSELVPQLIEFVADQFTNNQSNECELQEMELITEIVKKVPEPTEEVLGLIPLFMEMIKSGEHYYLIDTMVTFASCLISKPEIFSVDGFFDQIVAFGDLLLESDQLPDTVSLALLFFADIIQNAGVESIPIAERALAFIEHSSDTIFFSAIAIVASAIKVSLEAASQTFDAGIFQGMLGSIERLSSCDPIVGNLIVYALSVLAAAGNTDFIEQILNLASHFQKIALCSEEQDDEDFNIDDIDLSEEDFDATVKVTYLQHILPSDKMTTKEAIAPIAENTEIMSNLSEELKELISQISK